MKLIDLLTFFGASFGGLLTRELLLAFGGPDIPKVDITVVAATVTVLYAIREKRIGHAR